MLFNTIDFAVFLPIVFILYWFATNNNLKLQNFLIVVASYVFYGWWDWKFLVLILFSTIVDYLVGRRLEKQENPKKRKILLWTSILVNLGFLGFFKYYNFFLENFITAFSFFGSEIKRNSLNIILPVGISFYTLQTLSYSIDVYKRKLEPTKDFIAFSAFVSFFPQLVAGPIERATRFLPQFYKKRTFDYSKAVDGVRQIIWGLFKKVVIADNCAKYANLIFDNSADYSGSTLALGAVFLAFQVYGDFSGYSDIAIGTARLFGFNLMQNFKFPYFSRNIAEFWNRWHISLSSWLKDYLYIPLGGGRNGSFAKARNIFIVFTLCGFWHGATWNFIIWGVLNAFYFLPLILIRNNKNNSETVAQGRLFPTTKEFSSIFLTFSLTVFGWIICRSNNIEHAVNYTSKILSSSLFTVPEVLPEMIILLLVIFIFIEWFGRERKYAISHLGLRWNRLLRYTMYYTIIILVFWFNGEEQEFIYFQF